MENKKQRLTGVYFQDKLHIVDAAADLAGMSRSAYIRDRMVKAAARDIDALAPVTEVDHDE